MTSAEVPTHACFENIALLDERTLEITFRKDKVNAGQVLAALAADGLAIVDVSTRDPDLEDVFLSLVCGRPGSGVKLDADVLIVGSGAAGLTAALNLAETHKVAVIAKGALGDSASARAQGGIAAVLEEGDSFEAHVNDTMIAGAGPQRPPRSSSMWSRQRPRDRPSDRARRARSRARTARCI